MFQASGFSIISCLYLSYWATNAQQSQLGFPESSRGRVQDSHMNTTVLMPFGNSSLDQVAGARLMSSASLRDLRRGLL